MDHLDCTALVLSNCLKMHRVGAEMPCRYFSFRCHSEPI